METTVNQLAENSVSMVQGKHAGRAAGTAQYSGDIFMMLIQNIIDGGSENEEALTNIMTAADGEEKDLTLLEYAGMMAGNPEMLPVDIMQLMGAENSEQLISAIAARYSGETKNKTTVSDGTATATSDIGESQTAASVLDATPKSAAEILTALAGKAEQFAQAAQDAEVQQSVPILGAEYTQTKSESNPETRLEMLSAERNMRSSIGGTKQESESKSGEEGADLASELVNGARTEKSIFEYQLGASKASGTETASPAQQVKTAIEDNLEIGNREFTLRLKPESLGEITVKLTEKDGVTTLDIVTKSADAAKRINDDIAMLRDAVKPMQVEVREATTQRTEAGHQTENNQQFNMFSQQQFAERQQQQYFSRGERNSYNDDDFAETLVTNQQQTRVQQLENKELDTYV